jgi:hypothetical protein
MPNVYQWQIDQPLPVGTRITVDDERLSIISGDGQLIHVAALPPSQTVVDLRRENAELREEVAHWSSATITWFED